MTMEMALSTYRSCHTRGAGPAQAARMDFLRTIASTTVRKHRGFRSRSTGCMMAKTELKSVRARAPPQAFVTDPPLVRGIWGVIFVDKTIDLSSLLDERRGGILEGWTHGIRWDHTA